MAVIDLAVVGCAIATLLFLGRMGSVLISLESRLVRLEMNQNHMRDQLDQLNRKI